MYYVNNKDNSHLKWCTRFVQKRWRSLLTVSHENKSKPSKVFPLPFARSTFSVSHNQLFCSKQFTTREIPKVFDAIYFLYDNKIIAERCREAQRPIHRERYGPLHIFNNNQLFCSKRITTRVIPKVFDAVYSWTMTNHSWALLGNGQCIVCLTGGRSGVQPADSQRAGRQGGAGGGRLQRRDTRLRGNHQVQKERPRDRPSVGVLQVSSPCYVLCVAHVLLTWTCHTSGCLLTGTYHTIVMFN